VPDLRILRGVNNLWAQFVQPPPELSSCILPVLVELGTKRREGQRRNDRRKHHLTEKAANMKRERGDMKEIGLGKEKYNSWIKTAKLSRRNTPASLVSLALRPIYPRPSLMHQTQLEENVETLVQGEPF
jgi:hypothetical protein